MRTLLNDSFPELKSFFQSIGQPAHRASQIFNWVYKKWVFDFNEMSDLPRLFRAESSQNWNTVALKLLDNEREESGETVKFLFETQDKLYIESVLIHADDDPENTEMTGSRITLCVSSQAGCPLGCLFCATGKLGFKRNLDVSEIISQVLLAEKYLADLFPSKDKKRRISNIVFMGMGEPLLNLENVMKSIRILNDPSGYQLGARHFTLSTAGLLDGIQKLSMEPLQIRLAVSLHTADQAKRENLMPVSKSNPLKDLIAVLKEYQRLQKRRITFEYILIDNFNMDEEDVLNLSKTLSGLDYNLNLIVYNPAGGLSYTAPSEKAIRQFCKILEKHKIPYVMRSSKGGNIKAGCGQLGLYWENLRRECY